MRTSAFGSGTRHQRPLGRSLSGGVLGSPCNRCVSNLGRLMCRTRCVFRPFPIYWACTAVGALYTKSEGTMIINHSHPDFNEERFWQRRTIALPSIDSGNVCRCTPPPHCRYPIIVRPRSWFDTAGWGNSTSFHFVGDCRFSIC